MPNNKDKIREDIKYKPDTGTWAVGMTKKEIKTLLWWACIGIARSKGGMYEKTVPKIIHYFAKEMKIKLPYKPEFNAKMQSYYKRNNHKKEK